jgi:hypothetical protein
MQFASDPWNLYATVRSELDNQGYTVVRADEMANARSASHVWTMIDNADVVLVDMSAQNVNVYIELGVAAAWRDMSARGDDGGNGRQPRPLVALLGDRGAKERLPFDVRDWNYADYDPKDEASIRAAVRQALQSGGAQLQTIAAHQVGVNVPPPTYWLLGDQILRTLPSAVGGEIADPAAAILATRYIQQLGILDGEELAATISFPQIGYLRDRRPLIAQLLECQPAFPVRLDTEMRGYITDALEALFRAEGERDHRVTHSMDLARLSTVDRRLTLVGALRRPSGERTSAEARVIAETLSRIAAADAGTARLELPERWLEGIAAIAKLTRLTARSAPPGELQTRPRIQSQSGDSALRNQVLELLSAIDRADAEATKPAVISTLGGAYFFGHSTAILTDRASDYAEDARALHELTSSGQFVPIPDSGGADFRTYVDGLRNLAAAPEFVFSVEHPFHFRVLLEVLSDENRRYPAECILTSEALRLVLESPEPSSHVVWFRDQLSLVANLLTTGDDSRSVAYLQHYLSFGRTPHTSSFMRLEYTPIVPRLVERTWWPSEFKEGTDQIVNLPNSVVEGLTALKRQAHLGRLWRGEATDVDLRTLAGEVTAWSGDELDTKDLVRTVHNSSRWLGLTLPELAIAEVQVGRWLIAAMRNRWKDAVDTLGIADPTGSEREDLVRTRDQAGRVLNILARFSREYVGDGPGDNVAGFRTTLARVSAPGFGGSAAQKATMLADRLKLMADDFRADLDSLA